MKKDAPKTIIRKETGGSKDKPWNPRFWDGVTVCAWFKSLVLGRFCISPLRLPMALVITLLSPFNSLCALGQRLFYGRRIRQQKVSPPLFILGHWRSGTTLLHEYMILDDRFTYADTYTCFAPSHFLFTHRWLSPFVGLLMPKKRPMDNMAAGLSRPQEDEFALCVLGEPSPYMNILFPNARPIYADYLTMREVPESRRKHWLDTFERLIKAITVASPKTVILKSPPHTARIRTILQRFPDAKFVYIHRNPYVLFPSTFNLWLKISATHGLQIPKEKGLAEKVLSDFTRMDEAYTADKALLKPGQITEISYDELVADPVGTLEKIYAGIGLGGFDEHRAKFEEFAAAQKGYKKNRFSIAPEIAEQIAVRWKPYLDRYGYTKPEE
ncbi:MAG: sulfotransferase [Thermoguttaceae bacterium]|nr:sulfotransferase [Thermoguttaceae bacterium]